MNETDPPKRSLGERLNTWVQTIGILIAAAWGVYTFVHKEITAPRAAPVNISLDLQLKKLGANEPNKELVAVELKASATNPSTREIHLLPNLWTAYGINVVAAKPNDSDFRKLLVSSLADPGN